MSRSIRVDGAIDHARPGPMAPPVMYRRSRAAAGRTEFGRVPGCAPGFAIFAGRGIPEYGVPQYSGRRISRWAGLRPRGAVAGPVSAPGIHAWARPGEYRDIPVAGCAGRRGSGIMLQWLVRGRGGGPSPARSYRSSWWRPPDVPRAPSRRTPPRRDRGGPGRPGRRQPSRAARRCPPTPGHAGLSRSSRPEPPASSWPGG